MSALMAEFLPTGTVVVYVDRSSNTVRTGTVDHFRPFPKSDDDDAEMKKATGTGIVVMSDEPDETRAEWVTFDFAEIIAINPTEKEMMLYKLKGAL